MVSPGVAGDLCGNIRVWNDRVNMGCYELGSFVFGDLNCDGAFNGGDIDPYFICLGGGNCRRRRPARFRRRDPATQWSSAAQPLSCVRPKIDISLSHQALMKGAER